MMLFIVGMKGMDTGCICYFSHSCDFLSLKRENIDVLRIPPPASLTASESPHNLAFRPSPPHGEEFETQEEEAPWRKIPHGFSIPGVFLLVFLG